MNQQSIPSRFTRLIISCFVVLNLATVGWINLPESVGKSVSQWIDRSLSPPEAYRFKCFTWRWQQYAHHAGLDNRWQMFGRQSRFNWWYDIRAVYSDEERAISVLLPLPNQSARGLAQRFLFDLKERKFELNLYRNSIAREAYSRYLARQFPTHDGMPIQRIRWQLGSQSILPPAEAVAKNTLHSTHVQLMHLNDFEVKNRKSIPKPEASNSIPIEISQ